MPPSGPSKMAAKFLALFFLSYVALAPLRGNGWNFGQFVHGDDWPSLVYKEALKMEEASAHLQRFVQTVHQYLVSMLNAAQAAEEATDVWKKRFLLRIVQTRIEELRIGRKEVKHLVAEHRKRVNKVKSHAKPLKKKLPLWYDGIARTLRNAREIITKAEKWLESEGKIVESEEILLEKNLVGQDLDKLPPLNSLIQPLALPSNDEEERHEQPAVSSPKQGSSFPKKSSLQRRSSKPT